MDTRNLLTGVFLALAVFLAGQLVAGWLWPPPPPPDTPPREHVAAPLTPPTGPVGEATTAPAADHPAPTTTPSRELQFTAGPSSALLTLGGRPDDVLELTLSPRGAAVESIRLTTWDDQAKTRYKYGATAERSDPYEVVAPVLGLAGRFASFATHQIRIDEYGYSWKLSDLTWHVAAASAEAVTFTTALRAGDSDADVVRLTKTYELAGGKPLVNLALSLDNVSDRPLTVTLFQDAATGIRRESPMYEMRRLLAARRTEGRVESSQVLDRNKLRSGAGQAVSTLLFQARPGVSFAWTALANRFFGVFIRALPPEEANRDVVTVEGTAAAPESELNVGDMLARLVTRPVEVAPQTRADYKFEIYAGPKDTSVLKEVNPEFVEQTGVYYTLAHAADSRCCTFEPLPAIMIGLLHGIQVVVRNYGLAIIVLVVIVRTLLHPLTVYQQKQMYRMQDGMARLQPKMQAIREKYANDKVRQNQEIMKLYSDEGVNPMAGMVSMLPLFIQMPILVALWTGLNTDVALRHAPFDGFWITDLAAPDALISFTAPITIPILGQLPLIGRMFQDIPSFNLLPLFMGISMYLQQRYMPKPGMHGKTDAAKTAPPAPRKPGQLSPEDQLRQQQMIGYMMTIMFPLMFYYMPAGLNLYWMATNVFGIGESLLIRKQIREEKERQEREGVVRRPKKKGLVGQFLANMAARAEDIQRKADELSDKDGRGGRRAPKQPQQKKR
jgi:YidC/Oxa1 family membrane protein insertase